MKELSARALGAFVFALLAVVSVAQDSVPWRSGPEAWSTVTLDVASKLERLTAGADSKHVLVRHSRALLPQNRQLLSKLGVSLVQSAGRGFSFARVDANTLDAAAVARLGLVLDARAITPLHRLHPTFARGEVPAWASIDSPDGIERVAAYVVMHADLMADPRGYELLLELGADVKSTLITLPGFVVELPRANLGALSQQDEVLWIEPPLPRMGTNSLINDSNRIITQVDQLQAAPYGLDGAGVGVLVYDAGTAESTPDLNSRLTVRDSSGGNFHATHVAGTVGGDGSQSGGTFRGMAPGVTIESYGFEYDGSGIFLYTNPGDFEADYLEAINVYGVDVSNNSIGSNIEPNGFPCSAQGDYGVMSSIIDDTVRGGLTGSPFRVVWSAGNERQGNRCDVEGFGDFYSLPPPSAAKNQIGVGALNSNNDTMTSFSSWGPTDDGRLKPDLSGPGCQSNGDGGVTSSAVNGGYQTLCGTSMSGPTVAGICALLLEDYRVQFGGLDPRNSTLKALLIQTVEDGGDFGPDYEFGYGSVRARDAVDEMRRGLFFEDTVDQGSVLAYQMNVAPGASEVRITLAWDDVAGTPNVIPALVNDLDLVVLDPSGTRRFPWGLNPNSPNTPATRTAVDRRNNVEQVFVQSPQSGTWTVEVHGFDVPSGPQPFSLVPSDSTSNAPSLQFVVAGGVPDELTLGVSSTIDVDITALNDTLVGNSPTLHLSYDGGAFVALPMTPLGGSLYRATLPGPACDATPEFYLSAVGVIAGARTFPAGAPSAAFLATIDASPALNLSFVDDFEGDQGWTTANIAITGGAWDRNFPLGGGDREDPPTDADGSGRCFLTESGVGNTDVDGGPTRLLSPNLSLAGTDSTVEYSRWFGNDDNDGDRLDVHVSNDGGSAWTLVESVGDAPNWTTTSFRVADFVAPTNQVRVRFSATDNPNDSVTEAGIDAFRVFEVDCTPIDDCDDDGIEDTSAIAAGAVGDVNGDGVPDGCVADCDGDGVPDDQEPDCDSDGLPDDCEADCNGDGTPDDCVADCDNDGTPDDCEPDCDSDGLPDDCEADCDSDGLPDDCEADCNGDGNPDDCVGDCDGDGIADDCEPDCNGDEVPDDCESDCDADGVPDVCEPDCDFDGLPDDCEADCDGDGEPDECESDCDFDQIPDDCDAEPDCNLNGVPDNCDIDNSDSADVNSNGIPDECEDCDSDGVLDPDEIDCDSDGIADDCETDWLIHYGAATAGAGGVLPQLDSTGGAASIGTSDFTLVASDMAPNRTSILALGFGSANFMLNGASVLVDPGNSIQLTIPSGTGIWNLPLTIPDNAALIGLAFYTQVFVVDPGSAGGLAASDGAQGAICGI